MDYSKDHNIFSILGRPGPNPVYDKFISKAYRKIVILDDLDQSDKSYDVYGYKHSGTINM